MKRILGDRGKSHAKEFVFFAAGVLIFQFSRTLVNIISARHLGPEAYAPWNVMQPIISYYAVITLGIPNAVNREIPFLIGAGRQFEAQNIADTSFTSLCILLLIGTFGWAFLSISGASGLIGESVPIFAALLVVWHLYNYAQILLKSRIEFKRMALQLTCYGLVYPVLTLSGVNALGFDGFLLGNILTALLVVVLIFWMSPIRVHWNVDIQLSLRLARIGWPIMGAGLLFAIFMSVDRWLIAAFLEKQELGYYTVAAIASGLFVIIPSIVSQQIYPRIVFEYGKTMDVRRLRRLMLMEMSMNLAIMTPVVAIAYVLLPTFVGRYMPAYLEGVSAARIILAGMLPLCLVTAFGSFLNTINRQIWYFSAQFIGIFCNLILGILFVKAGRGLDGVALSTAISYWIYSLCVISMGYYVYHLATRELITRERCLNGKS